MKQTLSGRCRLTRRSKSAGQRIFNRPPSHKARVCRLVLIVIVTAIDIFYRLGDLVGVLPDIVQRGDRHCVEFTDCGCLARMSSITIFPRPITKVFWLALGYPLISLLFWRTPTLRPRAVRYSMTGRCDN